VEITNDAHERGQLSVVLRGTLAVTSDEGWRLNPPDWLSGLRPTCRTALAIASCRYSGSFSRLTRLRQTLLWFPEYRLQFPTCSPHGQIHWKRPHYGTLEQITNPVYGDAYAYGKSECTVQYEAGGPRTRERRKPKD
jgi:hypothetical protein